MDFTIAEMISNGDSNELNKLINDGWNPNEIIQANKYTREYPLNLALMSKQNDVVRLLIDRGANVSIEDDQPLVTACQSGNKSLILYLLEKGADINCVGKVGKSTLMAALYSEKWENIITVIDSGVDMRQHGGKALRKAAWEGNMKLVRLLVENGSDINYNEPDMVHPFGETPLYVAVSTNQNEVAEYLLEKGADVTIPDCIGSRPYLVARANNNQYLMELIKKHEPIEWHKQEVLIESLKKRGLPEEIISYLGTENKKLALQDSEFSEYIVFNTIEETTIMEWEGIQLINLLAEVENYGGFGILMWAQDKGCFAVLDIEHDVFSTIPDLAWESFLDNPSYYIDKILSGDYFTEE